VTYIVIDGDDIGRTITGLYLKNDPASLGTFAESVKDKVCEIADLLRSQNFEVIFCAADGVAGHTDDAFTSALDIYRSIEAIGGKQITFSAGVGNSLREAYIALLASKSNGKAQIMNYSDIS